MWRTARPFRWASARFPTRCWRPWAIIALPSRTRRGRARIVPTLAPGAGVVTTRAHVHLVATEYGCVDLYGLTLSERAAAMISIAHPDDRERLNRAWAQVRR